MNGIVSVSDVNRYIKELVSKDAILSDLRVRGEISNFKYHYTGHLYFTIKDDESVIKCVMFRSHSSRLDFMPDNGMKVIVEGYVSVFEKAGQYQLYVQAMYPDGTGSLHIAFEQLKKKLEEKGFFRQERKKPIPFLPSTIAVVTSHTGSVIRDILNVVSRRFPNVHIKIFSTAVQGKQASGQICRAIERINALKCADVIILARGGGSLEELWPFNEENVAMAIYKSEIPIISAVGHETDFTISDFVADMRAPTPSAAAEIAVPDKRALKERIGSLRKRVLNSLDMVFSKRKGAFEKLMWSVVFKQPFNRVYQERMRLDIIGKDLHKCIRLMMEKSSGRLSLAAGRLEALSPVSIMSRGYSITTRKSDGKIRKSLDSVETGDDIQVRLINGTMDCIVNNKYGGEWYNGKPEDDI